MTVKYKKITAETFNYAIGIPECPSKGAFKIAYNGHTYFVIDGKPHKENGPAMILSDGSKFYYQKGELHREDGPAEIYPDDDQYYYHWGKLHRLDGPAVILSDGSKYYHLFDKEYSKEEWEPLAIQLNLKGQIL